MIPFKNSLFPPLLCVLTGLLLLAALVMWVGIGSRPQAQTQAIVPRRTVPQSPRFAAIEALTGARTRVVWLHDTADNTDYLARGTHLQLMGLDTSEGRQARVILPAGQNMAKPMFTVDGQSILFSDRHAGTMHLVDWEGMAVQDLGEGFALHTWRDPKSDIDYLYYAKPFVDDGKILPTHQAIYRRPLSRVPLNPGNVMRWLRGRLSDQLIWDQTQISEDSYQLSADGRFASAPFPWPEMGVHDVKAQRWGRHGRGCWTAMSPDNDYVFWIFDGPHRNLIMERVGRTDHTRWSVNVSNLPETDRYEVYHPRWSNHSRIIAVSGPYKEGDGGYRLPGGGAEVAIWLGRFSEDLQEMEHWVRASDHDGADFYPDIWVEPDPHAVMSDPTPMTTPPTPEEVDWPVSRQGLSYLWEHASAQNEIELPDGQWQIFRPEAGGWARHGEHHTMWVDQGYFHDATPATLTPPFSIEATLHDPGDHTLLLQLPEQWQLGQNDGHWWMESAGERISLGHDPLEEMLHIVVAVTSDTATLYVNGTAHPPVSLTHPLPAPSADRMYWGGAPDHPGAGRLSHLAIYDRVLLPAEIEAHHGWLRHYFSDQPSPPVIHVRARLVGQSTRPTPEDIAPYRRALLFNEYEIMEGERQGERFLAAHWAILDAQVLPDAERKLHEEYELALVLFEQRPELEGERVAMDNEDFLLEWYYDLNL